MRDMLGQIRLFAQKIDFNPFPVFALALDMSSSSFDMSSLFTEETAAPETRLTALEADFSKCKERMRKLHLKIKSTIADDTVLDGKTVKAIIKGIAEEEKKLAENATAIVALAKQIVDSRGDGRDGGRGRGRGRYRYHPYN